MSKNYLFKVVRIKTDQIVKIYGQKDDEFLLSNNIGRFYWDNIDNYKYFEGHTCKTCNNMYTFCNACLDYDLWEGKKDD